MNAHGNLTGELTGFVGGRAELALVRQSLSAANYAAFKQQQYDQLAELTVLSTAEG